MTKKMTPSEDSEPPEDWSRGWARRNGDGWPEEWGSYLLPPGDRIVRMYRGRGNRVRFYDASGEQVGPEQSNVAPAVAAAHSAGWVPLHRWALKPDLTGPG